MVIEAAIIIVVNALIRILYIFTKTNKRLIKHVARTKKAQLAIRISNEFALNSNKSRFSAVEFGWVYQLNHSRASDNYVVDIPLFIHDVIFEKTIIAHD